MLKSFLNIALAISGLFLVYSCKKESTSRSDYEITVKEKIKAWLDEQKRKSTILSVNIQLLQNYLDYSQLKVEKSEEVKVF